MNERRKSDRPIVPRKFPNKAGPPAAEGMEGRGRTKGNSPERNALRTQGREGAFSALERVRQAAKKDKKQRFTALFHHIYDVSRLEAAYRSLNRRAAPGVDGETWRHYGEDLEGNLKDLSERLKRGGYRAKPVRRTYISKTDGRQRPLGVPALEDKIVQRATVEVLNGIYETDFLGFSYGFRPGRNPHQALDALTVGLMTRRVSWVLDADLRSFFDTLDHGWLAKFVEHRIGDRRVCRLIQKWLKAGVLDEGKRIEAEEGAVQGGSISPLLANLYLHYVFDLWVTHWRKKRAQGEVIVVRYADDFIVGFQRRDDAERFLMELKQRLQKFHLELHPEKTRLLEFGRKAAQDRARRGERRPETFDFLGFTHCCSRTGKKRGYLVVRRTMRKRLRRKVQEIKVELRRRMHWAVPKQAAYLRSVLLGHYRYYGVSWNGHSLQLFRRKVARIWLRVLRRRSQKHRMPWARLWEWVRRWFPEPQIHHAYPWRRICVNTRGGSRMR